MQPIKPQESTQSLNIAITTIFPELFTSFLNTSLIGKSIQRGLLTVHLEDIRKHASPPHHSVDDTPYGGGAGMVMRPEVLTNAIENAKKNLPAQTRTILLSPSGRLFNQEKARELSRFDSLILVCGRYEGVDQRVIDLLIDEEISIGDYVVMGGEIPAMVILEAVLRLRNNVLGNPESILQESFSQEDKSNAPLEGPQYTRPPEFRGKKVPEVLLSGDHKLIARWREEEALKKTLANRADLLNKEGG